MQKLSLVCNVNGRTTVSTTTNSYAPGKDNKTEWRTGTQNQVVPFTDRLTVVLEMGTARAQMPNAALPPMHGGRDGWYDIRELSVTDEEIRGKVAINFLNHADIRIDRRTGGVVFKGLQSSFSGQCEKIDTARRAF